ncbi:HAMP domain-containing sensor histidine kinase [Virgibacillus sp. LDC-1]|uniref:sensor histidine kinase n=1 Tax=Virgibacillus sp. LDC-1 TaxID=3039856 RepID=UPI0024DEBFFE|nr:HAMP domain-containing sensor histidine kinase [Virgibacillus sp. LDC-1]
MRTLYVRIIYMTMAIMIASTVIAFITTNVYYHHYLKPKNDDKITRIAVDTVEIYEEVSNQALGPYLSSLTGLGYQFYVVGKDGKGEQYGTAFRTYAIEPGTVASVIQGNVYHGIKHYPWRLFVTGFFDNELTNTVGVPITINGETKALFVRPNTMQQFGEMRFFLAVLIVVALLITFLFIIISTRFLVKPIKKLTAATKKIAAGNYHLKLNVSRKDEIGELAKNFSSMSASLAKTEEKRQEFVSNVSHEIQSPLTSIKGFSQALQEADLPPDLQAHYLQIIEKESTRLSTLSQQLLTLSFLDSDADQAEFILFDVKEQWKDVIHATEWQWRQKEIELEIDAEEAVMLGNPKLMQQVWQNLLTNAIRYTNQGGRIDIRVVKERGKVVVAVQDNGIGIAEEHIPHLFERFYKVDKARTRTENSTGLGLSIVKKIIELHHGTIMVDSKQGEGTTFQVVLPEAGEFENQS